MTKSFNGFSPKLLKELPKLKPGEKLRFQLLGVRVDRVTGKLICPQSFYLQPTDRIFDPGQGDNGDFIDIAHVKREVPAPRESMREKTVQFGEVSFMRANAGIIELIGGNMAHEKILPFLFFCNKNKTNANKPWHVKPTGKYVFEQLVPREGAKKTLREEKKRDEARAILSEMNPQQIEEVARGMMPSEYMRLSNEEIILRLRKVAQLNPEKILGLSKDVEIKTTAFVETALKMGFISIDTVKNQVIWADDKTKICTIKPGVTAHVSLKRYFMTDEGIEVLEALEKMIEQGKTRKKTVKAGEETDKGAGQGVVEVDKEEEEILDG